MNPEYEAAAIIKAMRWAEDTAEPVLTAWVLPWAVTGSSSHQMVQGIATIDRSSCNVDWAGEQDQ